MLYVQQSLGPEEEILARADFHWMYNLIAILWIVFGVAAALGIGYGAIWWSITTEIRNTYGNLPPDQYNIAWTQVLHESGGYKHILWSLTPLLRFGMLGLFLLGLFFYAHLMIVKVTTEIAVTNERVIYKKGLIARYVSEVGIDRIEGVSVSQGVWGRIWGYGTIVIHGMGLGEVYLPELIDHPIRFRKAIQEAKSLRDKAKAGNKGSAEDF